jgi:hypothetical protein
MFIPIVSDGSRAARSAGAHELSITLQYHLRPQIVVVLVQSCGELCT